MNKLKRTKTTLEEIFENEKKTDKDGEDFQTVKPGRALSTSSGLTGSKSLRFG